MVHALEQVHRMLRPGGLLVDVHDLPAPSIIGVHASGTVVISGWLTDKVDYEDERHALNSIARIVTEGYFLLEDERDFRYSVYADNLTELRAYLEEWWETAVLADQTAQKIEESLRQASGPAKIVIRVPTRMIRLRAAGQV